MDKNMKRNAAVAGGPCCWLGLCCPPEQQIAALADEIDKGTGLGASVTSESRGWANVVAAWVLDNFDLAPKGSLQAFKDAVRDLAREGYVKAKAE